MIIWCNKKCAGEQGHLEDTFQHEIYKFIYTKENLISLEGFLKGGRNAIL